MTADKKEYLDREEELARLTHNFGVSAVLQE